MICVECKKPIDTQNEEFEEAASCQFIHTKCADAILDAQPWSGAEDSRKANNDSHSASKAWQR